MFDFLEGWSDWLTSLALSQILPALIIGVVGVFAIRLLIRILKKALEKSRLEKAAHSLITSVVQVVLYVLLALIVASRLGIDVSGIIALASVLTLAVSLAVENALANVFGGFTLLYTQPFHSGDYVEIAGQSGTVQEIGLTYTKLTTPDNKMISIPNSAVTAAQIVNYSVTGTRRVDFTVTVSFDSSMEQVLAGLLDAARMPEVLEDPSPFAAVKRYSENGVEYVLQVWVRSEDFWTVTFAGNRRVKECLDSKGVKMTYPHLNVHLDK